MVKWEGIEDTGVLPTRIWLSRPKLDDENAVNPEEWQPLRKVRYLFIPLIVSKNRCVFYFKNWIQPDIQFHCLTVFFVCKQSLPLQPFIFSQQGRLQKTQ